MKTNNLLLGAIDPDVNRTFGVNILRPEVNSKDGLLIRREARRRLTPELDARLARIGESAVED